MTPRHPAFEQHWREFTMEYPDMLTRSRYVIEADGETPVLSVDFIGFMNFVRWAKQKGYGPAGVPGLLAWVQQAYPRPEQRQAKPDDSPR